MNDVLTPVRTGSWAYFDLSISGCWHRTELFIHQPITGLAINDTDYPGGVITVPVNGDGMLNRALKNILIVRPTNATEKVKWTPSDSTAIVDTQGGWWNPVKPGTYTMTATAPGVDPVTVTVKIIQPVERMTPNYDEIRLRVGDELTQYLPYTYTICPENATDKEAGISYGISSEDGILQRNDDGTIKAVNSGSTTVWVYHKDIPNGPISLSVYVIDFPSKESLAVKNDPLIITGSIGTNNTYFHSSAGLGYMSPLSNSFFANLNFNIYGFSMPFSIYFSNDNLNFSYPQFSFNLSPSYKNFTAHIGQSSMPFSQYVLNMSFNGVGLEWRDKQFRASAFYGVLRRAVNDNPDDPTARIPQYRRYGWGISAGYSKGGNSIDLYFLRAYDSESSIDERWRTRVRPQENLVLGLKGQLSYKNFLSLAANVATSAFTADRESQQVMTDEARRFDKIFETRYTSRLRFAGDATLGLTLKGFNASIFYKYIQPDYVSLGTYYTSNNYHTLGLSAGTTLFRRLTLSASFSGQEDNLAKQQLYTTRGYVYNAMASLRVSDRMNVTAMYNGYLQSQGDGTAQVNDTTEIHRMLHSFSLVPTYNLPGELFDHTISLSANYTENRDLNKFSVGQTDVKTLALGASYNLNVKPWETNFTFSLSHQNTKGFNSEYSSDMASISTGRSFLKEKNLSTSATVSLNYNEVRHHSKSLSMGVDLSASYTLKKYHSFSLGASFSQYGDVNLEKTRSTLDNRDVRLTFNYLYTFTLLQVSAKKKDKKEQKEKGSKGR